MPLDDDLITAIANPGKNIRQFATKPFSANTKHCHVFPPYSNGNSFWTEIMQAVEFPVSATILIRPCTQADLPKLEWFGEYAGHRTIFAEVFASQQAGEALMLVAELNQFPVGQIWIDFASLKAKSIAVLWALRVLEPLQRLGIGRRLITVAEEQARGRGFAQAAIGVEKSNDGARRLYEQLGYKVVGDHKERWTSTTPEGDEIEEVAIEWIMHKML
jgi:ribosomal protein S18 acetylase RimI-like enzyme